MRTYIGNQKPNTHIGTESTMLGKGDGDWLVYRGGHDALLYGQRGGDHLGGGDGDDALYGGRGRDELTGGAGENYLYGGKGKDVFMFLPSLMDKAEADHIMDYKSGKDSVSLPGWVGTPSYDASTGVISFTDRYGDSHDIAIVENRPAHVDFTGYVPAPIIDA